MALRGVPCDRASCTSRRTARSANEYDVSPCSRVGCTSRHCASDRRCSSRNAGNRARTTREGTRASVMAAG